MRMGACVISWVGGGWPTFTQCGSYFLSYFLPVALLSHPHTHTPTHPHTHKSTREASQVRPHTTTPPHHHTHTQWFLATLVLRDGSNKWQVKYHSGELESGVDEALIRRPMPRVG